MKNIILTQNDADFILAYLRSNLQRLNDNCDRVFENGKKLKELKTRIDSQGSEMDKAYASFFDKMIQLDIDEYSGLYKKQTDTLVKCIELLTVGSPDV